MEFAKAKLQEVEPTEKPTPKGDPIVVQINPASLRMQLTNNVDVGKAQSRSATQAQGSSSSTLTFDLVFDTADEGKTDEPVDVRDRTKRLERFVLPSTNSPKSAPPRLQFTYGTLSVVGVMSALNVDFDLFSLSGVPLRAKCSVTIKEQKPEFDAKKIGAGANTGAAATSPVPPAAGPRGAGGRPRGGPSADRTGTALGGESAADFAHRMGLDPRAWKDVASALADPLRLEAGLKVDFSSSFSLDIGLGVEAGVTASIDGGGGGGGSGDHRPPTPSRPGRPDPGPVPAEPPGEGSALTAQGGLTRALDKATVARADEAASQAKEAFASPSPKGTAAVTSAAAAPAPAAATVTADARAVSFGYGVPLRPRVAAPHRAAPGLVHERVRGVVPSAADGVPETDDPTVPPWRALPQGLAPTVTGRVAMRGARGCARGCCCGGACGGGR